MSAIAQHLSFRVHAMGGYAWLMLASTSVRKGFHKWRASRLLALQEGTLAAGGPLGGGGVATRSKTSNDGWYDLAGWGIMVVAVIGILALARNSQPVAPGAALK